MAKPVLKGPMCELCGIQSGARCCEVHDIVICARCYEIVTEKILWPTIHNEINRWTWRMQNVPSNAHG